MLTAAVVHGFSAAYSGFSIVRYESIVLLLIIGCIMTVAFESLPFIYIKSASGAYDRHVKEEMETAPSITTTSYIRSYDILRAVQENISYQNLLCEVSFKHLFGDA